jgi:LmbE family N-acetylglucosaminyl deacetylase
MATMDGTLKLMAVLAHPDDESLGFGGTLARYAAEGIETSLVCATRGERGWTGEPNDDPGPLALGRLRETELRAAADVLGIADVTILNYVDGDLQCADPAEVVARIVAEMRRVRPDVVVTFGPDGAYGHPDHVAISQLATTAIACAADPTYDDGVGTQAHRVAKLYYRVFPVSEVARYEAVFGELTMQVDGHRREAVKWSDWAVSARLDTSAHCQAVWAAVSCHRSQIGGIPALATLSPEGHRTLWGRQHFFRVISAVHDGHGIEDDLFAGLRVESARSAVTGAGRM